MTIDKNLRNNRRPRGTAWTAFVVSVGMEPFAEIEALRGTGLNFTARTIFRDPAGIEPFAELEALRCTGSI